MRKFLSGILYLFVGLPLVFSALLMISVRPWALDKELYKKIVTDDRLYAALRAPEIAKEAPDLIPIGKGEYDGPALVATVQANLPVAEIKALGVSTIDKVFSAIQTGDAASLSLDLRPLKDALAKSAPKVARDYVGALPTREGSPDSGDFSYRPSSLSPAAAEDKAAIIIRDAVATIPDTVKPPAERPLINTRRIGRNSQIDLLIEAQGSLSQAGLNRMTAVTAALSALLIAGLGALGAKGIGRKLSRAGGFVLLPSLGVLAVGAILAIPSGLIFQGALPPELQSLLGGQAGAQLRDYVAEVLGPIARSFFITGLVGSSLGGLLISAKKIAEPKEIE